MKILIAVLLLLITVVIGQPESPEISTQDGNLQISSPGDVVFRAGQGGQIQFMSSSGENLVVGQKGDKGDRGDAGQDGSNGGRGLPGRNGINGAKGTKGEIGEKGMTGAQGIKGDMGNIGSTGPPGSQGLRGASATDSALVTWNECVWQNLDSGTDYGLIVSCSMTKARNDTWLRITWSGNMRITACINCCMRWYFTINGEECSDPGPIDAVMFQSQNYHILRHSTITGSCRATNTLGNDTEILAGPKRVQFLIMECPRFGGFVYNAFTGFNSISRIRIEEVIPRDETFPEVVAVPPMEYTYTPNYCQYFFPHLSTNRERNLGVVASAVFTKRHHHTVLRLTWEGNLRKKSCRNCCIRWWIEIGGSPCSNYEQIETSIRSSTAQDVFAPTSITGICFESANLTIHAGSHQIRLLVGNCVGSRFSNGGAGFFSTSRLLVDEIPLPRDPLVRPNFYHPQWAHCAFPSITGGNLDEGALNATSCTLNKTTNTSSVRVAFNGNLRLTNCMNCCARWFVTLNGQECTSPAPIEAIIYSADVTRSNIHRGSTVTGICDMTEDGVIPKGNVVAILNVGPCEGFNRTFDAHTGLSAPSTFTLEELPQPVDPAPSSGYSPIWTQCVSDTPLNDFRDITTPNNTDNSTTETTPPDPPIQSCSFRKRNDDTVLRIAWDGSIAVLNCTQCCMRWFVTLNGRECSDPGPIDAALVQDLTDINPVRPNDLRRPTSIMGICRGFGGERTRRGNYNVELMVGACQGGEGNNQVVPDPSSTVTGYNSVSRFIVEEIPDQSDSECLSQIG